MPSARSGFFFPGPEALAKSRSVPFLAGLAGEGLHEPDQITLLIRATGGDVAADRAAFERPSCPQD